jgi:TolB-like protein
MPLTRAILLGFGISLALVSSAHAAERQKLAVLDLEAKGVDKATAQTVTEIVTVALKRLGVFDVISRQDIQQMLNFEESKQLVGCSSSSNCIAEIGGALGVAKVITGSVGKLGNSYVLNLSLLDTKSAKVIERESRNASSQEALVSAAENGSRFLVRSLLEGKQGDLIIKSSESNAEVEIDGKLIGLTPVPRVKLASGPHTIRVSKKGFISYARDIVVQERDPTVLEPVMLPSKEFIDDYDRYANGMRIGAYLATGVGVAAFATGLVLRLVYNDPRASAWEKAKTAYDSDPAAKSPAEASRLNTLADSIQTIDELCLGLMISGGVVTAAGVVLFLVGPKPGIYDQYKTVSVGDAKLTFDMAPLGKGGFASATLRW